MSKKITEMPEVLSLLDTDFLTGIEVSALPADQNVKIQKTNLGFAADDDPRLSDARAPTAHASTHATGQPDAIAPADIGAEPAFAKNTAFNKNFGTIAGTVAEGNAVPTTFLDLTDTPASYVGQGGKAVGVNPGATALEFLDFPTGPVDPVAWGEIVGTLSDQLDLQAALDGKEDAFAKNSAFNKSFGTLVDTVCQGNDARLSDARTPTAHAASHGTGQADELAPADIGAVPTTRQVASGTGLQGGGDLSANRTLSLANTAVTPGPYTNADITVDAQGRITAAANGAGGGASTFIDLTDTPANYAGANGQAVAVNAGGNGLEFRDFPAGGAVAWGDITGTLSNQTDLQAELDGKEDSIGAKGTAFNKNYGAVTDTVCEGDDPRLSDKRPVVSDAVLDGYVETPGTGLPTTGTITVPLDGRIHEVTLTGDATVDIGAVPAAGNVGSAILFLTPAGNNVSYAAGLYWAGGQAVVAGAYMRYTLSNSPAGNKIIDAEELATV